MTRACTRARNRARLVVGLSLLAAGAGIGSSGCSGGMSGSQAAGGSGAPRPGTGGARATGGTGGIRANGGLPGVEVKNGAGPLTCIPLCVTMTDPAADPQGDDYGYEMGSSCIIPHTATATNDPCTTGASLPPPVPRAGVVIRNAAGNRECVAKCVFYTSPTQKGANTDGFADDWAYENNATCIIPGTVTASTSQSCTTLQPVPPDQPRPGVVVVNPTTRAPECVAKCTYFLSPTQAGANGDNLGDDWAFEFGASCIIPGTVTSFNDPCTTMQPLPPPVPRPGIMVNADPVVNSCSASACVPLCQHVTVGSDPAYPDWGWENNNSCVIPGSRTATTLPMGMPDLTPGAPPLLPPGPTRKCTWGVAPPDFLSPPALNPTLLGTRPARFQTMGKALNDPYGRPFLIRGVNNSDGWYDGCGQYSAYQALDLIAAPAAQGGANANTVRLGWAFKTIDPVGPLLGQMEKPVIGTNAKLLAEILYRIVELKMVAIIAPNDSTGQVTVDWPLKMANFLLAADYKAVLKAYEPYLLVGIANEWNGVGADYLNGYTMAIQALRAAGVNNTLVVTANEWGQGCDSVLQNATALINADSLRNILFDLHLYTYPTFMGMQPGNPATATLPALIQGCLDAASTANIPVMIGEFGNTHGAPPVAVPFQLIIDRATANGQGYIPWLWYGDTEFPALNLATNWSGTLTAWGNMVVPQIRTSAVRASIFQ